MMVTSELDMAILQYLTAEDDAERSAAKARLREIAGLQKAAPQEPASPRPIIEDMVAELGIPAAVKGYTDLITAIELAVQEPRIIRRMTRDLNPKIAELTGSTAGCVSRNMRHAIEVGCARCEPETLTRYFGSTISAAKGMPTNREFIACLAIRARRKLNGDA